MALPETWADWLGVAGSVASLVSLATLPFSIYAALKIRSVGKRIAFNVHGSLIVDALREQSLEIHRLLKSEPYPRHELEASVFRVTARIWNTRGAVSEELNAVIFDIDRLEKQYNRLPGDDRPQDAEIEIMWQLWGKITIYLDAVGDLLALRRIGGDHESK